MYVVLWRARLVLPQGLLNLADALKELAVQRLLQRLAELRGESWTTVRYYALLDTGLHYVPSSAWWLIAIAAL